MRRFKKLTGVKSHTLEERNSPYERGSHLYSMARDHFFSVALDWVAGERADDRKRLAKLRASLTAGVSALEDISRRQLEANHLQAVSNLAEDLRSQMSLVDLMADRSKPYSERRAKFHESLGVALERTRHASSH